MTTLTLLPISFEIENIHEEDRFSLYSFRNDLLERFYIDLCNQTAAGIQLMLGHMFKQNGEESEQILEAVLKRILRENNLV